MTRLTVQGPKVVVAELATANTEEIELVTVMLGRRSTWSSDAPTGKYSIRTSGETSKRWRSCVPSVACCASVLDFAEVTSRDREQVCNNGRLVAEQVRCHA